KKFYNCCIILFTLLQYTAEKAKELGLRGWCMNTKQGTVSGIIQGERSAVDQMKEWLKNVGSPQSKIEKCNFSNEREIPAYEFNDFSVHRTS
ncbi:acylphosphatase-1-like protein, partial [Leptotrombidium deliense]